MKRESLSLSLWVLGEEMAQVDDSEKLDVEE